MSIIDDDTRIPASRITPLGLMPDGIWLGWDEHGSHYARMKDPKNTDGRLVAGLVIAGLVAVRILDRFMPVIDDGALRLLLLLFAPCLGLPVGWWYGRRAAGRVVWLPYEPPSNRMDAYARRIRRLTWVVIPILLLLILPGMLLVWLYLIDGSTVPLLVLVVLAACVGMILPTWKPGRRLRIARDMETGVRPSF